MSAVSLWGRVLGLALLLGTVIGALVIALRGSPDAAPAPTAKRRLEVAPLSRLVGALAAASPAPEDAALDAPEPMDITADDDEEPLDELRLPLPAGMSRSFQLRDEPPP